MPFEHDGSCCHANQLSIANCNGQTPPPPFKRKQGNSKIMAVLSTRIGRIRRRNKIIRNGLQPMAQGHKAVQPDANMGQYSPINMLTWVFIVGNLMPSNKAHQRASPPSELISFRLQFPFQFYIGPLSSHLPQFTE